MSLVVVLHGESALVVFGGHYDGDGGLHLAVSADCSVREATAEQRVEQGSAGAPDADDRRERHEKRTEERGGVPRGGE